MGGAKACEFSGHFLKMMRGTKKFCGDALDLPKLGEGLRLFVEEPKCSRVVIYIDGKEEGVKESVVLF